MIKQAAIDYVAGIRHQNLEVYRVSPSRLKEDVGQEAEIAHDYRGRLVYELLQNADDAMLATATLRDRVVFRLDEKALWVGNSGRPLDEADVAGLCGIGASRKSEDRGPRRASIGHKGMGFKSVLEITASPEVYSNDFSFRLDATMAKPAVGALFQELSRSHPDRVPAMRFPWPLDDEPSLWRELRQSGINTLFRFPLRRELTEEKRELLARRLTDLPITAVLFLKHLEIVQIDIATARTQSNTEIRVLREAPDGDDWSPTPSVSAAGPYRITLTRDASEPIQFLLAHDGDVVIGDKRAGLDPYAWDGVEFAEVSVAAPVRLSDPGLPDGWNRFHVFLPTNEPCPFQFLVNGAFATDLSRQEIRISDDPDDYNRHLLKSAASLLHGELIPALEASGKSPGDVILMLASEPQERAKAAANALHEAVKGALHFAPLIPGQHARGGRLPLSATAVPSLQVAAVGGQLRGLLADDIQIAGRRLPHPDYCQSPLAEVLVDLGATELTLEETLEASASPDPERSRLRRHTAAAVWVDPVLEAVEAMWALVSGEQREAMVQIVRRLPLFPVSASASGEVLRVATTADTCFLPPRHLSGEVPLAGLRFLAHDVAWGELRQQERNSVLGPQIATWTALFDLKEFRFPEVMRASVLPALVDDPNDQAKAQLGELRSMEKLAAICRLSGRTPKPASPLPYERLGSERALFNLARLPVPVRAHDGSRQWVPAYRAYFGEDWLGERSVEHLVDVAHSQGLDLNVPFLVGPHEFAGLLSQYEALATEDDGSDDEVGLDEDDESTLESDEHARWLSFLAWLGVNDVLRPVHFHDVDDRGTGWLTTRGLTKPRGTAFASLPAKTWQRFEAAARKEVDKLADQSRHKTYWFELHDLEFLTPLLHAASRDASAEMARALFDHLGLNWSRLQRYTTGVVAVVPVERDPGGRSKPAKPYGDEPKEFGDNLWLWRIRGRSFVPTSHGPRRPREAWMPSAEADRRFARKGQPAGRMIPILDTGPGMLDRHLVSFATYVGVRHELTPANFRGRDAQVLAKRLETLYADDVTAGKLAENELRTAIRPAYRQMFELLAGTRDTGQADAAPLESAPLLCADGRGRYEFRNGADVYYTERSGSRERLGDPDGLWLFVIEASPGARAPLTNLFGVRVLEDAIERVPSIGEPTLDGRNLRQFASGLKSLVPYLLARLLVERSEEQRAKQDRRLLESFIDNVTPVESLAVSVVVPGRPPTAALTRDYFVRLDSDGSVSAYVVWGGNPWPPSPFEAEALAAGLAEVYQASMFEPFLALMQARSDQLRLRVLRNAGASLDLDDVISQTDYSDLDGESLPGDPPAVQTAGEDTADDLGEDGGGVEDGVRAASLWAPEQIAVLGQPVLEIGEARDTGLAGKTPVHPAEVSGAHGRGATQTDLIALDRLGMSIAMAYEAARIAERGRSPDDHVFDVSSAALARRAREISSRARKAFDYLYDHGVSQDWPGFDILRLAPDGLPERMIELKSSGFNARVQAMTWNEWKTAQNSPLRSCFYLYLVGNLRSDLGAARPYVRAVKDPFSALLSTPIIDKGPSRIQLRVDQFPQAEFLELTVIGESSSH